MTINLSPPGPEQLAEDAFEAPKRDWHKRYSVPRRMSERRITVRPYESFRDRRENDKPHITYGYAALSTERKHVDDDEYNQEGCSTPPSPSTFSIYGDDPGPSSVSYALHHFLIDISWKPLFIANCSFLPCSSK
ncbi:unnamed protein product [Haemonchus placei]|uniref:Uncharacterized protein n=1 Tax=Haemonchus placei TaxID=6290 RepID=A0A0N4VVJ6_HAEPC|nr:unnamed protein product [Haemonchus placei]